MIGVALLLAAAQIASSRPSPQVSTPAAPSTATVAREPGSNLTVYLLTMGPGDQVWERFGHNAIWIHDDSAGTDIAYNWGLFDFAAKDFVPRFIQGRMLYSMGAFDLEQTIDSYRRTNRTVWAQELNLAPAERLKLAQFVAWNLKPENRDYSYDYYRDNCSTRVRDALDSAMGGVIRNASESKVTPHTYRFHTSRLTQDDWPIFTGTMLGLGEPGDRPITVWEEMFLPVKMKDRLDSITVQRGAVREPLVLKEQVLFEASRPPEPSNVTRGMTGYLAIAAGLIVVGAGLLLLRRKRKGGGGAIALASAWNVIAGLAGTLLAFLWIFTDHVYSYRNENLFQLNPLSLLMAVLLLKAIWARRPSAGVGAERSRRNALACAVIVAGISVLGFALQALPGIDQVNGNIIALAMPLHLGTVALLLVLDPRPSGATPSA